MQDIHRNIYAALNTGEHWANWRMYLLGRYTTVGMREDIVAKELGIFQWNLGAFSKPGRLGPGEEDCGVRLPGGLAVLSAGLQVPTGRGRLVTFQNRLSLTIQAHHSLTTSPAVTKSWIQNWIKEIEIDLESMLNPAALA